MNRKEIVRLLSYMNYNYSGRFKFPRDSKTENKMMIEVWLDLLKYYDYSLIIKVLKKLMITNAMWPPSAGELIKEAEMIMKAPEDKLTAGEAWSLALNAVRNYGYYEVHKAMDSLPKKVKDTVEHFGGFRTLCHSDITNGYARNQFMRLYKEVDRKDKELLFLPDKLKNDILMLADK
ncbi:replicative helicase loader/inhibitor [Halanaerobium hydrogeniformans]|uniref:Replicative helicase inhibitor G39P N-terminal domain-containing protein n=1 Tax=Halanaerobium hydrogeniformans TaxID=656519 RepID=E4RME4_HALHG|nr:replicative helicase loader/inhibitor [Halanaerobium hydrogeniformans]ADQ14475.1 hypothetical protein Halsa_1034 [Halanaerobium hydrogeniformans]